MTLLAFTPVDVFLSVITAIMTILLSGFVSVVGWRLFGQSAWRAITDFFSHVEGVDAKLGELVTHAKAVDARLDKHDALLETYGRQLEFNRGREAARQEYERQDKP